MRLHRIFLTAALAVAGSLLPGLAQAQLISDPAQAGVARDSVLLTANRYRAGIEQQAQRFNVKVFRLGKRRRVVHGYYLKRQAATSTRRELAWKHVARTLRSGTVRERYVGYIDKQRVLEESRTNGQVNYVRLHRLVRVASTVTSRGLVGQLSREGYVTWQKNQFLFVAPTRL